MAGPLDGIDLGTPATTTTTTGNPAPKKPAASSGPLAGIDLSAPPPSTAPATYDDASTLGLAGDTAYRAANTGTLGALDYGLAGVHAIERGTGYDPNATDLATIHKQNEEWGNAHPYLGLGADLVGYSAGFGKLGLGAKLAERAGGSLLARGLGAGVEQAGASAVSNEAATQGQIGVGDLLKQAAISGTVGGVTGLIPGGKGAMADMPSPTKALEADTANAFKPLETTHYDPNVVGNQFDAIKNSLAAKQTPSDALDAQINKISQSIANKQKLGQSVTADDLTNFQIDINKASRGGRDIGIAKAYNDGLDQTMANTKPLFSPLGGPAAVAAQSDAARAAANKDAISNDIDDWMTQAKKTPDAARQSILDKTTANPGFYPGSVGDMLKQAGQPPGLVSKAFMAAAHPAADTALGAGLGYMFEGQDLPTALASAAIGGVAGAGARHALAQSGANQLVNQLARARHFNATGQTVKAPAFNKGAPGPLGPMAAYAPQTGVGVGVSNLFGPTNNPGP